MAAVAAAAMTSCSNDLEVSNEQAIEDGAIVFDAYAGRATREYVDITNDNLGTKGFGVYAYDQGTKSFSTYTSTNSYPNFMYNQMVTSTNGTDWVYTPIKYYNNNEGAQHSFFAYAPHNENVNAVFALGSAPAIRYNAADRENECDLLYAQSYVDMVKPGVSHKIAFDFKHALAKVNVYVAPFVNTVHDGTTGGHETGGAVSETEDPSNTKVIVRSIKFVGTLASQALLNLGNGQWTYESTEESAYELTGAIDVTANKTDAEGSYNHVMTDRMFIPTRGTDKVNIQIVYDVITTDPDAAENGTANNSTITNTITSIDKYALEAGKAYKFYLDLGMTTVDFKATVDTWNNETENVDLPNNNHWHPIASAVPNYDAAPTALTGDKVVSVVPTSGTDIVYCTADKKIYDGTSAVTGNGQYVNEGIIYVVTSGTVSMIEPTHYSVTSAGTTTLYKIDGTSLGAATQIYSLIVNSDGKIQIAADSSASTSWDDATDGNLYFYGNSFYKWDDDCNE